MSFSVIGIDPSSRAPAFALWPSKHVERVKVPGSGSERLCALYQAAYRWTQINARHDLRGIFIERPKGRFPSWPLWQSTGVLQVASVEGTRHLFDHAPTCFELSPGEWRKEIGLKGNATKDEVIAWAHDLLTRVGFIHDDLTSDESDALAIAAAGHSLLTKGEDKNELRTEEPRAN